MVGDDDEVIVTVRAGRATGVGAEEEHPFSTQVTAQALREASQG